MIITTIEEDFCVHLEALTNFHLNYNLHQSFQNQINLLYICYELIPLLIFWSQCIYFLRHKISNCWKFWELNYITFLLFIQNIISVDQSTLETVYFIFIKNLFTTISNSNWPWTLQIRIWNIPTVTNNFKFIYNFLNISKIVLK